MPINKMRIDQLTKGIVERMTPEDRASLGLETVPKLEPSPKRAKADRLESAEQGIFANFCLSHGLPFVWHRTDRRSTATTGAPDFVLAIGGSTLWLEFKRPGGRLSPEQAEFRGRLERHGARYYVVHSAAEAIELTRQ